ncbi:MAG: dTMP kinase [Clostridia bacterium]|nr:dTMP kinase [Clostridia bacterium]
MRVSRGFFITLEGIDASGKTTQLEKMKDFLSKQGYEVETTREPGGTKLSEAIRQLLLRSCYGDVYPRAEILLYASARAQHVAERIKPALSAGKIVLCDRFTDSSIAYQGYGRQLGPEIVRQINKLATEDLKPDLTILLDIPVEVGVKRRFQNGINSDRLEQENIEFHKRVRQGYLKLAAQQPTRIKVIDGAKQPEVVWLQIKEIIKSNVLSRVTPSL